MQSKFSKICLVARRCLPPVPARAAVPGATSIAAGHLRVLPCRRGAPSLECLRSRLCAVGLGSDVSPLLLSSTLRRARRHGSEIACRQVDRRLLLVSVCPGGWRFGSCSLPACGGVGPGECARRPAVRPDRGHTRHDGAHVRTQHRQVRAPEQLPDTQQDQPHRRGQTPNDRPTHANGEAAEPPRVDSGGSELTSCLCLPFIARLSAASVQHLLHPRRREHRHHRLAGVSPQPKAPTDHLHHGHGE